MRRLVTPIRAFRLGKSQYTQPRCKDVVDDAAEAAVRSVAQLIFRESVEATHPLRQLASRKKCTLQLRLEPASIEHFNQLLQLSGGAFDRHYLQGIVQWQEREIRAAQDLTVATQDAKIRSIARQFEHRARRRLSLARRLLTQRNGDRRIASGSRQ